MKKLSNTEAELKKGVAVLFLPNVSIYKYITFTWFQGILWLIFEKYFSCALFSKQELYSGSLSAIFNDETSYIWNFLVFLYFLVVKCFRKKEPRFMNFEWSVDKLQQFK